MSSGREEGEIDSEEDGLRKRITELEEENAKYEKIRGFADYVDKYGHIQEPNDYNDNDFDAIQRAGQVPTDVSSISSVEFPSPKKKKHKKNKKGKCKLHARRSSRCSHQRHKHYKNQVHGVKRHHHHHRERVLNPYYESRDIETISLDSTDMSDYEKDNYSIAAMEIESPDEDFNTLPLSREELRLALGRGKMERKNNVCSLRERLQPQPQPDKFIAYDNEEKGEIYEDTCTELNSNNNGLDKVVEINSDNSISIEEHELRLIALRSAIMKKHATRKKRNAEIAYSPTDFDDLVVEPISIVDSEIEELDGEMEISPASSPRVLLSPIHCDYEQNSNLSLETVENQIDNKPVDMDIVGSDSEHEDQLPTHEIPLPAGAPLPMAYDYAAHTNQNENPNSAIPYEMFMPAMPFSTTTLEMHHPMPPMPPMRPMPPMIPIPALPTNSTTSTDAIAPSTVATLEPVPFADASTNPMTSGEVEDSVEVKNEILQETSERSASPKSANTDIIKDDTQEQPEECSDEEEAEALRALLLAQRQIAKGTKTNGAARLRKVLPQKSSDIIAVPPQPLSLRLPMVQEKHPASNKVEHANKPTESILKEAVRRLKIKTAAQCPADEQSDPMTEIPPLPRLTVKSFARIIREDDEEHLTNSKTRSLPSMSESSNSNDVNRNFRQLEESRSSLQIELRRSTPEILGTQSNSFENSITVHVPNKRRLENDITMGRTLRIIELQPTAESNSSSQCLSEESNGGEVRMDISRVQNSYEKQCKKLKTTIAATEKVAPPALKVTVVSSESGKECSTKERNVSASVEKENKEIPTNSVNNNNKGDGLTYATLLKAKPNIKVATTKLARAGEKRKVSPLTIAANATVGTAVIKPTATSTALPMKSTITTPTSTAATTATTAIGAPKAAMPLAKQLKIVKPNKVINKNVEVKQNAPKINDTSVQKQKTADAATQSRILTTSTLPNVKVNKLVIRVGDAESSSEDEEILRHQTLERCIGLSSARTATPDSLTGVLNENIYSGKNSTASAAFSQQQLTEVSNDLSVGQVNSEDISNASSSQEGTGATGLESFEKKLESFLRNMRSKTQTEGSGSAEHTRVRKISTSSKQTGTPTAVRSLPIASQEEYKRLVHRMKILEKQKQLKKMQKSLLEDAERYTKNKKDSVRELHKAKDNVTEIDTQTSNVASDMDSAQVATSANENLPQQSNTDDEHSKRRTPAKNDIPKAATCAPMPEEEAKAEAVLSAKLSSCERVFTNISKNIITRLDKSMKLVNDAKLAKIAKLRHEQRLKELRLEMEQTQRKMKEEQFKMSRIYPEICANNEFITKLKQKRTKVLEMTMKLGRSVKGDEYRLNNNLKNEISLKSKGLATNIKLVNLISYCDLDKLEKETIMPSARAQENNNDSTSAAECPENGVTNTEKAALNPTVASEVCDKAEDVANAPKTTPMNTLSEPTENVECTKIANRALDVRAEENAVTVVVSNDTNTQVAPENYEKLNDEVTPAYPTVEANDVHGSNIEEMAPPPPCCDGKEVQQQKQCGDQPVEPENVKAANDVNTMVDLEQKRSVRDYVSPLVHLKSGCGQEWNPNDIICPYELMGQCEDKQCSYKHLTVK